MSCLVTRDNNTGNILEVKASNGNRSRAFDKINSIPFFGDADFSYKVLSNLYSPKVEQMYADVSDSQFVYEDSLEPRIFVKDSKGNVRESIEQSIVENNIDFFELGVLNPADSSFVRIAKFNPNISAKSKGVLNGIAEGLISPERVLTVTGEVRFKGKGIYKSDKLLTARIFKSNFEGDTGIPVKVYSDGTLSINQIPEFATVEKKDGSVEIVHESEVIDFIRDKKNITNRPEIVALYSNIFLEPFKLETSVSNPTLSEKAILKAADSFFNSLGFTVTTMKSYKEGFKNRHGQDVGANALVDLGNKVVAIAEGGDIVENVTEELAHLLVETYADQASILGAMSEIHTTPEYSQYAEIYRQVYSSQHSGIELEDAVRKEILGKVMAREIKNRFFASPQRENIWTKVLNYLKSVFTPSHRKIIDKLSKDISLAVAEGRKDVFSEIKIKKGGVFYSIKEVDDKISTNLKNVNQAINSIVNLSKQSGRRAVKSDVRDLPKILNEYEFVEYSRKLVDPLFTNIQLFKARIERGESVPADKAILEVMEGLAKTNLPNILQTLEGIETKDLRAAAEFLSSKIETIGSELIKVNAEYGKVSKEGFEKILDSYALDHNLSKEERDDLGELVDAEQKDLTKFAKFLGVMSESSNPIISLLGQQCLSMRVKVNSRAQRLVNQTLREAVSKSWNSKEVAESILEKDLDSNATGFFLSPVNHGLAKKDEQEFINKTVSGILNISEAEAEKELTTRNVNDLLETQENIDIFRKAKREYDLENVDFSRDKNYFTEKEELYKRANVSDYTVEELANDYSTINEIRKNSDYMSEGNIIDRSKMTEEDKIIMDHEMARLKIKKSVLDQNLEIKDGLKIVRVKDLTEEEISKLPYYGVKEMEESFNEALTKLGDKVVLPSKTLDSMSNDSRYVLDSFNINFARRVEFNNNPKARVSDNLINVIGEHEEAGDFVGAFEFLTENGAISFTDSYYESMSGSKSLTEQIEDQLQNIREEDREIVKDLIADYSGLSIKYSEFLKSYRSSRNAFQTNAQNISKLERTKFKELESDLASTKRSLNARLKKSGIDLEAFEPTTELTLSENEAFNNEFAMSAYKNKLDFMLSEMSENNAKDVRQFEIYVTQQLTYENPHSEKKFDRIIERLRGSIEYQRIIELLKDSENTNTVIQELTTLYAVEKLPAYFQERVPKEWQDIKDNIFTGQLKLSEKLKSGETLGDFITINPNYTWTELSENKDYTNPYYKKSFGGGQPKFSKYRNQKFFDFYGFTDDDFLNAEDITQMTATKNTDSFEFYKSMMNVKKEADKLMGYEGNIYLAPQYSTTLTQKIKSVTSYKELKANLKDLVSDVVKNKPDELEYGEVIEGNVKIIPRFGRKPLEDPNAMSRDILSTILLDYFKAVEYSVRKESEPIFQAVLAKAERAKFYDSSVIRGKARILKDGQVSEVANRVREAMDYMIYGVKQSRRMEVDAFGKQLDLTKALGSLKRFSMFTNLGYNPLVAATSATTGIFNNIINRVAGDSFSKLAMKEGNADFVRESAKYLTEDGKLDANSDANTKMEFLGIKEVKTRFNEAAASRVGRVISESPNKMDEIANIPVTLPIMYFALNDTRMVQVDTQDGKPVYRMLSFDAYKALAKSQGRNTKAEVNAGWEKAKAFNKLMDSTEGHVKPTEEFLQHFTEDDFERLSTSIGAKIIQLVQRADGVLTDADKSSAHRDPIFNLFLQHKSWITLVMSKLWKKGGRNFTRGKYEEGYVRTGAKFIKGLAENWRNPAEYIKTYMESAKEYEIANLKRILGVSVGFAMMFGLAMIFMATDDEDDPFMEDFARIITYRTLGEIQSGDFMGFYSTVKGALENPATALSTFDSHYKVIKALGSIGSEKYGEELSDALFKNTILKRYTQLTDLEGYTQGWVWFNKEELPYLYNK